MKFLRSKKKEPQLDPNVAKLVGAGFGVFKNKEEEAAVILQRNIRAFLKFRRDERKRIQAELKEQLRQEAIIYRRKCTRDYWWEVNSDITRLTRREVEDVVGRLGLAHAGATRQALLGTLRRWLEFPARITDIGLQAACIAADKILQASGSVFVLECDYRPAAAVRKGDVRHLRRRQVARRLDQLLGKGVTDVFAGFGSECVYFRDRLEHLWLAKTGSTSGSEHEELHVPLGKSTWLKTPMMNRHTERDRVAVVSPGPLHCVAKSETGDIYTWGVNPHGELGIPSIKKGMDHYLPDNVEVMAESTTICIAAGTNHSLAVSEDGQIFGWGSNSYGQLGAIDAKEFEPFKYFLHRPVTKVSCGHSHCAALGRDGTVYTWGNSDGGRLGRDEFAEAFAHQGPNLGPVAELGAYTAVDVCCGAWHTAVVVEEDWGPALGVGGAVFTWGTGLGGQLGQGHAVAAPTPGRVALEASVKEVRCGGNVTAVLTHDSEVITWGAEGAFFPEPELIIRDESAGRVKSIACGTNFVAYCTLPVTEEYYDHLVKRYVREQRARAAAARAAALAAAAAEAGGGEEGEGGPGGAWWGAAAAAALEGPEVDEEEDEEVEVLYIEGAESPAEQVSIVSKPDRNIKDNDSVSVSLESNTTEDTVQLGSQQEANIQKIVDEQRNKISSGPPENNNVTDSRRSSILSPINKVDVELDAFGRARETTGAQRAAERARRESARRLESLEGHRTELELAKTGRRLSVNVAKRMNDVTVNPLVVEENSEPFPSRRKSAILKERSAATRQRRQSEEAAARRAAGRRSSVLALLQEGARESSASLRGAGGGGGEGGGGGGVSAAGGEEEAGAAGLGVPEGGGGRREEGGGGQESSEEGQKVCDAQDAAPEKSSIGKADEIT